VIFEANWTPHAGHSQFNEARHLWEPALQESNIDGCGPAGEHLTPAFRQLVTPRPNGTKQA
jgi:hypothetical protein